MGLYQLLYLDSVPDNAAVDESVKLAKKNRNPAASGFVNAMLREFIRNDKKLPNGRNATEELSIEYSAPAWLTEKWTREYGKDICLEMLKTSVGQAPVTARVNTVFHSLESTLDMLAEEGITFERLSVLPDCIRICGAGAVEHTKAYKEGRIHVQDLSSQLCCAALGPKENDTVLDLCAAPGGKTFTIAERMNNKGRVLAFDLHRNRAGLIESGAKRLGLDCIRAGVNNAKVFDEKMPKADKVLCDAPCSGLGVIRRKPEIKYKEPSDFDRLPEIQYDILKTSAEYVKVGGTLVYSTCTFAPAENEGSISRFLAMHEEFEIVPIDKKALGIPEGCDGIPGCVENPAPGIEGTLRLWPHKLKGEGHYAAVLQKKGKLPEGYQPVCATGTEKGIPAKNLAKDWAEYFAFAKETFSEKLMGEAGLCTAGEGFLAFGDNLYRMPERMPGVKGLKVLRPGLHLGTLKKNRFEPAHALALALCPKDVKHVWNLSVEEAAAYLKGQTFSAEGEKGWYLICVDGISLGWGKLAGGIMKNHYPKGLRKG